MNKVATEKMSDVERDALRVDIAKGIMAAMYTASPGKYVGPYSPEEDRNAARKLNASLDAWRAERAVDAANFLIVELELCTNEQTQTG